MLLNFRRKPKLFKREKLVYGIFIAFFILIIGRLFQLQTFQASALKEKGENIRTVESIIKPPRGKIYDNQMNVLADEILTKEVYIDTHYLTLLEDSHKLKMTRIEIAQKLAPLLKKDESALLEKIHSNLYYVNLAHQIDLDTVTQIKALKIQGIGFRDEAKRVYPLDNFASAVLGIVNLSGHGVEGVESYYDKSLFGQEGKDIEEKDASFNNLLNLSNQSDTEVPGNSLVLTLDNNVQYLIEKQLDEIMETTKAQRATIIAMEPKTGRILGMGARPTFNPNDAGASSPDNRRNLSIGMTYEPGSTFKIITGAAAIDSGAITPDTVFSDPGYIKISGANITNWDTYEKVHGDTTFTQGMMSSSNVVLSQVGLRMGVDNMYKYIVQFGFGEPTGIDIAGEQQGVILPKSRVKDLELATMAFGQTNLVTPLQILSGVSAIANNGMKMKPYVVDKILAPNGSVVQENMPMEVGQVVSESSAKQMQNILQQVVDKGTGHTAYIEGVRVAAKTGTAQKIDPSTGGYSSSDFIPSFIAFAPIEDPQVAVLVVIDSPQGIHQGGTLGGPRAKAIIQEVLKYHDGNLSSEPTVAIPNPNSVPSTHVEVSESTSSGIQ